MERVYEFVTRLGYPEAGIERLRRRRGLVILVLVILSWLPVIGIIWFLLWVFG